MVGIITRSSNLNSFSSICYCFIALGIHAYSSYKAVKRYNEADSKAWPGGHGTPSEVPLMLGSTVVSLLMLPFFCITCFIKVGNYANDGVKLGRDHALGYTVVTSEEVTTTNEAVRRVWRHFCPLSQTVHLMAAFLLLLPETLLTAVEVKFGYKSTDASWSSNLDFLFSPERVLLSEIRSSINVSQFTNATHVFLPTPRVPTEGWTDHVTVSIAFVNFCVALTCFLVRYSSVFWYTNKPLTVVFALQLLAMAMNSIFSFNSFSVLYCVCHNKKMYPNITLSLSCPLDLVLYLFGSTILMLSTMTVFEYGCHYFHEKFNIVERHHHPETYVKQTVVVNNGCQGYVPHSCAMAALIVFAVCKGPLLYDLVSLMRLTGDQLLLSGIICEVCYMVLWVALWFCLTIKQQWQFRILDYVSLRQPLYALPEEKVVKYSHPGHGDATQNDTRTKRLSGRDFPQKYLEPVPAGTTSSEDQYTSDIGTDESDMINSAAEVILDLDGNPPADSNSSIRRSRMRKNGGQRVTFDESVRGKGPADKDKQQTPTNSLTRQGHVGVPRPEDISHFNVRADVHNSTPSTSNSSNESSQDGVVLRKKAAADNREYRDSIRNKCGEYYSSVNNLSAGFDEPAVSNVSEHLPTLMSSFRDKVRESSLAASTFKERERHMLEHFDYLDPLPPPIVEDLQSSEGEKRRALAISDEDIGDVGYQLQKSNSDKMCSLGNSAADSSRYRQAGSADDAHARLANTEVRYRFDDNINDAGFICDSNVNSSSLQRKLQHNTSISSDEGHRSSFANSTLESSDLSIPPAMEDLQLGGLRSVTGIGNPARKDDYLLPHIHHPSHLQHNVNAVPVHHRPT